jgi:hypothetical protein
LGGLLLITVFVGKPDVEGRKLVAAERSKA